MQNKLRRGVFLKKSRKMEKSKKCEVVGTGNSDYQAIRFPGFDIDLSWIGCDPPIERITRVARCWNILRTLSDKELESLEKQTDLVIEEYGEEFVAVHVGPSLPF